MHYLFYVTKYIHVIHTLASHLRDKQGNWGQSGVDVSKPAGYAVCDGNMSSFSFFFLKIQQLNNFSIYKFSLHPAIVEVLKICVPGNFDDHLLAKPHMNHI